VKELKTGLAPVSEAVFDLAEALQRDFPGDATLLTGVTLLNSESSQRATIDLAVILPGAAVLFVEPGRDTGGQTTPREAGRLLIRLQQSQGIEPLLPVYVCWLAQAAPAGSNDQSVALPDGRAVREYIAAVSAQASRPAPETAANLARRLLQADAGPLPGARKPTPVGGFLRVLQELGDLPGRVDAGLQEQIRQPRPLRRGRPIRPADVNRQLQDALWNRDYQLEDARYGKIVPNEFLVELSQENYDRHYRPIERNVRDQWRDKLLEALNTANSRQGRREYRFGGQVDVRVRPVADLAEDEARIYAWIKPDESAVRQACLELLPNGRLFPLRPGTMTIGREPGNDIFLDRPDVQEKRLVSSQHAYLLCEGDSCRLFDGTSDGRPSLNGTFVNGRPVPPGGQLLQNGDVIVLAALDAHNPRPDRLGSAGFLFRSNCR
jgi:hypothetical protein